MRFTTDVANRTWQFGKVGDVQHNILHATESVPGRVGETAELANVRREWMRCWFGVARRAGVPAHGGNMTGGPKQHHRRFEQHGQRSPQSPDISKSTSPGFYREGCTYGSQPRPSDETLSRCSQPMLSAEALSQCPQPRPSLSAMFLVLYWVKVAVTVRHSRADRAWSNFAAWTFQLRTQWKKPIVVSCCITSATNIIKHSNIINHSHMWEGLAVGLGIV